MTLLEKSFKELTAMIEEIAMRFFVAKKMRYHQQEGEVLNEHSSTYESYLYKVEEAYQSLNEREKNLINNEFFFQNYHDWWVGLYSKTSFYRYKKQAMLTFLEAFYHA